MHKEVKGVIFDIDGVLEFQGSVHPGAISTLDELRARGVVLRFLTNSTLKSRSSAAQRLQDKGFQAVAGEVVTASSATAHYLKGINPHSCWVMLEGTGLDEFRDFVLDTQDPEYIVIGDNRSCFDFDHLNRILRLLIKGAKLIGMTSSLVDRSFGGAELNVGSWAGMLERASGVRATYIGKPEPYGFELAISSMDLDRSDVVMVGDQVDTDIQGALGVGIGSILVKTGEFEPSHLIGDIQPDYIFDSVNEVIDLF